MRSQLEMENRRFADRYRLSLPIVAVTIVDDNREVAQWGSQMIFELHLKHFAAFRGLLCVQAR